MNKKKVRTVIFLHLVKTAGTTLNQVLNREYSNILSFYIPKEEKVLFEDFKKKLKNKRIDLIRGHFEFGWHIFLSKPFVYFTILRDPIDRVLSEYYYILGKTDHPFYNEIAKKNVSLADFVKNWNAPNLQTRKISGKMFANNSGIPLLQNIEINDNNMLEIAKENLDKYFAVVGLSENFDETLILLKREFGWDWPFYTRQNVTTSKIPRENIPGATIEMIKGYNQLDIELYEYARQLLYEKIRQQGESFFDEVEEFIKLNKVQKNDIFSNEQIILLKGFENPEGPYPDKNLHVPIRWASGSSSKIIIESDKSISGKLIFEIQNFLKRQKIKVFYRGKLIKKIIPPLNFCNEKGEFFKFEVPIRLQKGSNTVILKYLKFKKIEHRELAILFSAIKLES